MELREQVRAWLDAHEEEMVRDIGRLVRYRSVSRPGTEDAPYGPECAAALAEMLDMGREYGFETHNAENRCGSVTWENGGKTIGLWAHLDVVPEAEGWLYPPYSCTRKGDFLIGRGVGDNKGPAVGGLYAMRCIRELGLPFRSSIRQVAGCDEEKGMSDVEYYVSRYPVPDFSLVTDSGFPVCYGEKGILEAELWSPPLEGVREWSGGTASNIVPDACTLLLDGGEAPASLPEGISAAAEEGGLRLCARGFARHTAAPEGGVNAIGRLCGFLEKSGLLPEKDRETVSFLKEVCGCFYGETLGIACADEPSGRLTCVGSLLRMEQNRAVLTLNIRYPVTLKGGALLEKLRQTAGAYGFETVLLQDSAPNYFNPDSPLVEALCEVYREATGSDAQAYVMGGGTYARKIPNAVAYGPGMAADFSPLGLPPGHGEGHSPDEALHLPTLKKAVEIYVLALLRLDRLLNE